jgi:MFS transporter, MCT family, solute carrier family 16 (monocarboxylic acid transporters), member 10
MLSRGLGNILSTPVSTSLTGQSGADSILNRFQTGFAVDGNKYEHLIIYVGTCFAGAAALALSGWFQE